MGGDLRIVRAKKDLRIFSQQRLISLLSGFWYLKCHKYGLCFQNGGENMLLFQFWLNECLIGALLLFRTWHWPWMMQLQYMAFLILQNLLIGLCYQSNGRQPSFSRKWSCLVTASKL